MNDNVSDGKHFTNLLNSTQNQESTQHARLSLDNFYENFNDTQNSEFADIWFCELDHSGPGR